MSDARPTLTIELASRTPYTREEVWDALLTGYHEGFKVTEVSEILLACAASRIPDPSAFLKVLAKVRGRDERIPGVYSGETLDEWLKE